MDALIVQRGDVCSHRSASWWSPARPPRSQPATATAGPGCALARLWRAFPIAEIADALTRSAESAAEVRTASAENVANTLTVATRSDKG